MVVDMHVHTSIGSPDSNRTPARLVEIAREIGLDGMVVAEHDAPWTSGQVESFRQQTGLFVCSRREWDTDFGHIIALGLNCDAKEIGRAEELHRLARAQGAFIILAHPSAFSQATPTASSAASTIHRP